MGYVRGRDAGRGGRGGVLTTEARPAGADVAAGHVLAGAAVHAGVGLALVVVDVAVWAAPARVAQALVAERGKERQTSQCQQVPSVPSDSSQERWRGRSHSPIDQVLAVAVDAGVADALVDLRQAGGVVVALRAQAGKAVDPVHAGAPVVAGVQGALVDVDVAHRS